MSGGPIGGGQGWPGGGKQPPPKKFTGEVCCEHQKLAPDPIGKWGKLGKRGYPTPTNFPGCEEQQLAPVPWHKSQEYECQAECQTECQDQ